MYVFELPSDTIYQYILTGKFQAPSPDWIHQESPLNDYELIVMTEGTLYLSYQKESFVVETGDFLLLPPGGIQKVQRLLAVLFTGCILSPVKSLLRKKFLMHCYQPILVLPVGKFLFQDMELFRIRKKL